ncbi:MAG: class I tRNA ligase family protein, partial [Armatimonadota bacterium]
VLDRALRLLHPMMPFVTEAIWRELPLAETDRANNTASVATYVPGLPWTKEMPSRVPIVVSNPSASTLPAAQFCQLLQTLLPKGQKVPTSTKGARLIEAASGNEVPCQIDGAGDSAELCFSAGKLAPYSCRTFLLSFSGMPGEDFPPALQVKVSDGSFEANTGALTLKHDSTKADLLSQVSAGDLPLGRFHALMHQNVGQNLWVAADRTEAVQVYDGPVRFAADVTVAATTGGADTKTAAGQEGDYAARVARPHRFRACYRVAAYPGQAWFTSRLLWVESTDTEPWELVDYFHYAQSAIGGKWDDDIPATTLGTSVAAWENPKLNGYYGFLGGFADDFRASYWRDPVPGGGEHPDVSREVSVKLAPGQRYANTEPVATFFGCQGTDTAKGIARSVDAQSRLQWKALPEEKTPAH